MGNEKLSGRDKMSKTVVILYIASAIMGILFIYMFIEAIIWIPMDYLLETCGLMPYSTYSAAL